MGKSAKRPGGPRPAKGAKGTKSERSGRPGKKPTNLTLDPEALARGERFGRRNGTSVSQLVTRFLFSLPTEEEDGDGLTPDALTPLVRRLYRVVAGGTADRESYRAHLVEKYGGR